MVCRTGSSASARSAESKKASTLTRLRRRSHHPQTESSLQRFFSNLVPPNGLAMNDLVKNGTLRAPIVIGRDHLDTGSVASPYRETEGMRDGSDAIADWPLLNALVNTAAGASWISIHNGGGVGIGYSLHAGMAVVADGTDAAARRLERVLTTDPGMGIVRHVDAGYEKAIEEARMHGVRIPMPVR